MAMSKLEPIQIPDGFWTRADVVTALTGRDIGRLFRLVRQYTGASQTRIGIATGISQGRVSQVVTGKRQVESIGVLERIADGLGFPDEARQTLGLAPRAGYGPGPATGDFDSTSTSAIPATDGSLGPDQISWEQVLDLTNETVEGVTGPMQRRDVFEAAGATLAELALSGTRLAEALTAYPTLDDGPHPEPVPDLTTLASAVTTAKRQYQACQYTAVMQSVPGILRALRVATRYYSGDDQRRTFALSTEAHHVAASILLKTGDSGLAALAADRSMQAAEASSSPLAIGSAARILTHTLMNAGHTHRAKTLARQVALGMNKRDPRPSPAALSVYGSLLLRGSIAAANANDRSSALELIDEADEAGHRLGGDFNHQWTAFGPTNVLLHRVNLSVKLGDAGAAIDYARRIDQNRIQVTERRASLYVDVAKAFTQWGKYDRAYQALSVADNIAPEEIRQRPTVLKLVADLADRAPHSIARQVRQLPHRARR